MTLFKFAIAAAVCISSQAFGANPLPAPNWDATLATQSASLPGSEARLRNLFELVRESDQVSLERELNAVIAGNSLSQPERDAILFRFTVGLADFDQVDPALLERLRRITPMVLVPHEERATVGVPLYNIAGAAKGVAQLHQRLNAQADAELAMKVSAEVWLDDFLLSNRIRRSGYVDSLDSASDEELSDLVNNGLNRLGTNPELTPAVGKSALLLSDAAALQQVVRQGSGAELARILEAAALTLPQQDTLALLNHAITEAPPVSASLAIAQLYPYLAGNPSADELLISTLGDEDLGGAAALAMATSGSARTRSQLRQIAQSTDGLASFRARVALSGSSATGGPE